MTEDKGPLGTSFVKCAECNSEADHICPVCHPECEAAFKPLEEQGEAAVAAKNIAQDFPLVNDLHHIEIFLSGNWGPSDLKALVEGFQAAAEAAKADGLGMEMTVIRKPKEKKKSLIIGADTKKLVEFPFKVLNQDRGKN